MADIRLLVFIFSFTICMACGLIAVVFGVVGGIFLLTPAREAGWYMVEMATINAIVFLVLFVLHYARDSYKQWKKRQ